MRATGLSRRKTMERLTAYAFLLPDLAGLTLFVFVPIVYAFYVSLHNWDALSPKVFVGLDNYRKLLTDSEWWDSLRKTLVYVVIYVPTLFVLSLLSAVLLNALKGKISGFIRGMFLMPFAITSVISAVIWMFLLDPRFGFVNRLLNLFGVHNQQFLGSNSQALYSIVVVVLWINLGYNMIIFLAAIKEIPQDYFEAAVLDGATGRQMFWHITLPLLREISAFIMVVTTIGSFQVFDQIQVMTGGGPANATQVSVLYIYKEAFQLLHLGYASALAFVLFVIIFVFSILQLRVYMTKE